MLNSTNFSYLFNYLPNIQYELQSFLCSQLRFLLLITFKETLLSCGCSVCVLHTNYFMDVTQTGVCELLRKWVYEEPTGISDRAEMREEGNKNGSNFSTSFSSLVLP